MSERPLILISNDDGVNAPGLATLTGIARRHGDVVVMAPKHNSSGLSHSITAGRPLRVWTLKEEPGYNQYMCDGTPADCVKMAAMFFCGRKPSLVLSGINAGSNASINELYSGTMGAVREACSDGYTAIGFSLLDEGQPRRELHFEEAEPFVDTIIANVLQHGLPDGITLNVNIPNLTRAEIKGTRVCRQGASRWDESYERRVDPHGRPYYWLTGKFTVLDNSPGTDMWALENGYISIVPGTIDSTHHASIPLLAERLNK